MADLISLGSRLDPELKVMLNRLVEGLTEYEGLIQPLVSEYKGIKRQIKKSQKGVATGKVKSAILELLNQKGFDTTLDYREGNFNNLQRAISSLVATDPGLWPDLIEKALIVGPEEGAKIISNAQTGLVKDFLNVGHHEQGLKSLRPVLEALQGMGQSLRERTLHVLETKYGFDFGELGLRHIFPFAHTEGSLGPGRGPTGIRKDFQPLIDAAFPELGGVKSIDQINSNLRGLIKPLLAHSKAQHGTGGIVPPIEAVRGLTDPNKIARALRPFLDAQKAGAENAMNLSNTIWQHGLQKVNGVWKVNRDAWLPDGALQKAIGNLNVIQLAPENQWGKGIKFTKPTVNEIQRFGSQVPIADTSRLNESLRILPEVEDVGNVTKTAAKGLSKTPARFLLPGALAIGGIGLSGMNVHAKETEFKKNPTLINRIQKYASQAELGLEGADIATGGFAAPATTPLQIGLFGLDQSLEYIEKGGRKEGDAKLSLLGDLPNRDKKAQELKKQSMINNVIDLNDPANL